MGFNSPFKGLICFPRNALRNTTHLTNIITITCFGTQVPFSGSYYKKVVAANMLIYVV